MGIIIKNTCIVTLNEVDEIIQRGYIIIKDDKITKIGCGDFIGDEEDFDIIDGSHHCVMPGLINCHTHAAMTLLRGYGEGLPLMQWLNEKIWPMERTFGSEHIRIGTEVACLEMLRSGTTTFNDMYFMQKEVNNVAQEFNMRAVLGIPLIGDAWENQLKEAVELAGHIKKSSGENGLVKTMFAPHSPYTLTKDALCEIGKASVNYNEDIHIHIAETIDEINIIKDKYGCTPCEFLDNVGIFQNKVTAAHCVHLTDNDIDILLQKDVSPVYNPQSNMKLASGVARVSEMLDKGINVCFGTDGASSNNNLNMFEEIETGAMLQKLWYKDATKLNSAVVLRMATINGARALGYKNLGMIKEEYYADLIMLDLDKVNMIPIHDIASSLVFASNGSEVDNVIVNGKVVMKNGEFLNIDEEKIIFDCNRLLSK